LTPGFSRALSDLGGAFEIVRKSLAGMELAALIYLTVFAGDFFRAKKDTRTVIEVEYTVKRICCTGD